jgi:hypothetical protein
MPTTQAKLILSRFHPSAFLLAVQLLLLILYAVYDGSHSERALISTAGVGVLVLIVWVVLHSPGVNWIAWALAIPAFILSLLSALSANQTVLITSSLLEAALYFYAAGSLIAYMMEDYQVSLDEIFAVGATFTLLAWGFAYLYAVCQAWFPGSFVSAVDPQQPLTFLSLLFLSFTNLSSAGLSDVLPVTPWARVLIMVEQLVGVGYVAMVVSRLIGLTIQRQTRRRP